MADGRSRPGDSVRKIAIVRALQLGDLLVAIPALRALRMAFPVAEVTFYGRPWASELLERFPAYFDRFVAFPGFPGMPEAPIDADRADRCFHEARAYGYDLVVQLHGDGTSSNAFAKLLGGRFTAGYQRPGQGGPPLDLALDDDDTEHEIHRWLRLAAALGAPSADLSLEFPVADDDRIALASLPDIDALLQSGKPLVGLHPGARDPVRRWPTERFAAIGDTLAEQLGAGVLVTGGPAETELAASLAQRLEGPVVNLAGRTSLGMLAAAIAECRLFISNDTGPAHLGVAVGTPSVVIFGAADPRRWQPLDRVRHRAIYHAERDRCDHHDCATRPYCLGGIASASVIEAAREIWPDGAEERWTGEASSDLPLAHPW